MTPSDPSPSIQDLYDIWGKRVELLETLHKTDGAILEIMDFVVKEQLRQQKEHGFWWHIKAAFTSLPSSL